MRWGTVVASFVAVVMAAALYYAYWPNEERIIRGRLNDIASIVTVPRAETDIGRIGRVADLRDYLSPNLHVRFGAQETTSRDEVLGVLAQWKPPDGIKVEFVDMQVAVDSTRQDAASVYLTAKMTGRDSVDAREANVRLSKVDGKWVVTAAETRETLTR